MRSRIARTAVAILIVGLLLGLLLWLLPRWLVDAERAEEALRESLPTATRVEVGDARADGGELVLHDLRLEPRPGVQLRLDSLTVADWGSLAWSSAPSVGVVRAEGLILRVDLDASDEGRADDSAFRIDGIELVESHLELVRDGRLRHRIEIDRLVTAELVGADPSRWIDAIERLEVERAEYGMSADAPPTVRHRALTLAGHPAELVVEDLHLVQGVAATADAGDRSELTVPTLRATVVSLGALAASDPRVSLDELRIEGPDLRIVADPRVPPVGPPATTPLESLRSLPLSLAFDRAVVTGGRIQYGERVASLGSVGSISFHAIEGQVGAFDADASSAVTRASVTTRVADAAPMQLSFELGPDPALIRWAGSVTELPLPALRDTFGPLAGLHMESGVLDRLEFDFRSEEGVAQGRVAMTYHDLSVESLGDDRRGGGLGDWVASLLLDLELHDARGEPGHPAEIEIEHVRAPDETFFGHLWFSLRKALRRGASNE